MAASRISVRTTYEPAKTVEPIHTGGDVSLDGGGHLLATCVDEDALIINIQTGGKVFRIENDGEPITSLALSPSASHLVVCSRSLSMRIYDLHGPKAELQRTLKPHTTPVITSTIDATGTLLATGGADGTIKVYDIRGGFATHNFHGHGGVISALRFFQSSSQSTLNPMKKRKNDGTDQSVTDARTFFLASGSEEGKIKIWNLQSRTSVASLESHVSVVKSLDFCERQETLLSASRDKTIILWNSRSWKPRRVIPVLEVVEAAGFILSGQYCYSGGEKGRVRIWSTSLGTEVTTQQVAGSENDSIVSIQCGPTFLLSLHLDQTFQFHDLRVLEDVVPGTSIDPLPIMRRISGNHDEIIDLALTGPDRSLLALATNTESIRIISIADTPSSPLNFGADVALLTGHSDIIICLDVDWSGHWLATGSKDNTARLWRLDPSTSSYTCFGSFVGHAESLGAVALPRSPPSPQAASDPLNHPPEFLITGSQDRTVKRWDTSKLNVSSSKSHHSISKSLYTRVAHEKDINAIDVSSTSPLFASASQDRTIKIWDLGSGSVTGILRGHKRGVWSIRFAPKETPAISTDSGGSTKNILVSGSGDRTVKLWSLSTYTCILTFEGHSNSVLKVLWLSPIPTSSNQDDPTIGSSGRIPNKTHPIIASASSDTLIKLWSPHASSSSASPSSTIAISDDHLLTTLDNHTDRVWALTTPTTVTHPSPVPNSSSRFLSIRDKYPLISGSADATVTLWTDTTTSTLESATAAATARIQQDQELQNHIRARNYRQAITLALQLNHPGRLLALFEEVISGNHSRRTGTHLDGDGDGDGVSDGKEAGEAIATTTSVTGSPEVDAVLTHLSAEQLYALLVRVRDWNTNARTAPVAQRILHLILKSYPVSLFVQMAQHRDKRPPTTVPDLVPDPVPDPVTGAGAGRGSQVAIDMPQLLRALEVYTERHLRRMEELVDESFLIEYTLGCMDDVLGSGGGGGGDADGDADGGDAGLEADGGMVKLRAAVDRINGEGRRGRGSESGKEREDEDEEEDDDDVVMV